MEQRVACTLLNLCKSSTSSSSSISPFNFVFAAKNSCLIQLPLQDYIRRLIRYARTSLTCIVMGVVLIDRVLNKHKEFNVNNFNVHRLLLTSFLVSSKFWDDHPPKNIVYAKAGCVSVSDLYRMEVSFLSMIGFDLTISQEAFWLYWGVLCPQPSNSCNLSRTIAFGKPASNNNNTTKKAIVENSYASPAEMFTIL